VIISGRANSVEDLNNIAKKIITQGHKATIQVIDLIDFNSFDTVCKEIMAKFGHIDILINNAAISK
jgi:NADP-dependent 3-hydroxy acid dehydrogenase YdfG